jgi:triosephosphate isomerase
MRKQYVAGNWKMNLDRAGARTLAAAVREHVGTRSAVDVALFPPYVYLGLVGEVLSGSPVWLGAQDVCEQPSGAFTGEVSAAMLADVGARCTLVGHSERRHVYGEHDTLVHGKVERALGAGLEVILCVGETLAEREAGRTEEVVRRQLHAALQGVSEEALARLAIAYEPVWAIGTGRNATPAQAQEVHAYLRGLVGGLYSDSTAQRIRILYGGSVKPDNAASLMGMPDIDGTLVGGASLQASAFCAILDSGR